MEILQQAQWIKAAQDLGTVSPVFRKAFSLKKEVRSATLYATALGLYTATLNGQRVSDYVLAPGWTVYDKRLQFQAYDINSLLTKDNTLYLTGGKGWCVGQVGWEGNEHLWSDTISVIAAIELCYTDGERELILSDQSWEAAGGSILYNQILHGEVVDARITPTDWQPVALHEHGKEMLVPQDGEIIKEMESLTPISAFRAPNGEFLIDFGQNLTGYIRLNVQFPAGSLIEYSHAEILDFTGNFYTENLRTAKQKISFTCSGGQDVYTPSFSFMGFRYIRIDSWPTENIDPACFTAVVVHSDMKRTGYFSCSHPKVNKLFQNIIWGQRGNFLDVPTDCPQRDERLGWTGDAQVFVRTASYNYNVDKFFTKWLRDARASQYPDGALPHTVPQAWGARTTAGWGDVAVVAPWQLYLTYADKALMDEQFDLMRGWVDFMRHSGEGETELLWNIGGFGDWLSLDEMEQSVAERYNWFISSCYYAYSTSLLIRAGKVLGKDMSEYETLLPQIKAEFIKTYFEDGLPIFDTQTAQALVLYFDLCPDKAKVAAHLNELVVNNGNRLKTGFLGTPYLLHALSDNGYGETAYSLLLQEAFPSWLYSVNMGATTIWEHWDGMNPEGVMWSANMNSFNHYAYGAVADWMYGVAAGINTDADKPGFEHIIFRPLTDERLDYVEASIDTVHGIVASSWRRENGKVHYTFTVPQGCTATINVNGQTYDVGAGTHLF